MYIPQIALKINLPLINDIDHLEFLKMINDLSTGSDEFVIC